VTVTRITPYVLYEDVAAALEWLEEAFGFKRRFASRTKKAL
jgi:uncharacterized glyoxalase superfamily protein PhnB